MIVLVRELRACLVAAVALAVGATLLFSGVAVGEDAPPPIAPPATLVAGDKAPHFALKTLNPDECGVQMYSTKSHFGADARQPARAIIISFLSLHCKPCMKELPDLDAWFLAHQGQGVELLGIDIDQETEEVEAVRALAVEKKLKFPVMSDRFNLLARRYKVGELPYLLVVDGTGTVVWVKTGYESGTLEALDAAVGPLLVPTGEGQ